MTKKETIERAALLGAVLAEALAMSDDPKAKPVKGRVGLGWIENDVPELFKLADRITHRAVNRCNYPMTEAQMARDDKADARDYAKASEIAFRYGATIIEMEDVRGFAIKLQLPTGRSNSFGGQGWGV